MGNAEPTPKCVAGDPNYPDHECECTSCERDRRERRELRAKRAELDAATAAMERLANRAIERLIRRGHVERADVDALRKQDAKCRRLLEEVGR